MVEAHLGVVEVHQEEPADSEVEEHPEEHLEAEEALAIEEVQEEHQEVEADMEQGHHQEEASEVLLQVEAATRQKKEQISWLELLLADCSCTCTSYHFFLNGKER